MTSPVTMTWIHQIIIIHHQNHHCYYYCNVLLNHGGLDHCQRHHGHVLEHQVIIFVMFKLSRKTVKQTDSGENFSPPPLSDFQRQSSTSNQSVVRFSKRPDLKLFAQVCGASLPSAGNIFFSDIVISSLSCWPTWKKNLKTAPLKVRSSQWSLTTTSIVKELGQGFYSKVIFLLVAAVDFMMVA